MIARLLALLLLLPGAALAQPAEEACRPAVAAAEHAAKLPAQLLTTISLVESGRVAPSSGRVVAWPWTINAGGIGFFYDTKAQAIAAARAMHAAGVASIDVGCMQISLLFHPDAFATLDDAFDPVANARFGARFLKGLYTQFGTWPAAAAAYHSQTPEIGAAYQHRVMALWPLAARFPAPPAARTGPDESAYTPEFRALMAQTRADHARLLALYGTKVPAAAPAPAPRPRLPGARLRAAPLWLAGADRHAGSAQFTSMLGPLGAPGRP
jgi:hypothetical protein